MSSQRISNGHYCAPHTLNTSTDETDMAKTTILSIEDVNVFSNKTLREVNDITIDNSVNILALRFVPLH
jgi:predicted transglutaminase-like cysteine proteinase